MLTSNRELIIRFSSIELIGDLEESCFSRWQVKLGLNGFKTGNKRKENGVKDKIEIF